MNKILIFFLAAGLFLATGCEDGGKGEGSGSDSTASDSAQAEAIIHESGASSDDLVGLWTMTDMTVDAGREQTPAEMAQLESYLAILRGNVNYTFNADGTMLMVRPNLGDPDGGQLNDKANWELSEDGKTLMVETVPEEGQGTVQEIAVQELTSSKLVGSLKDGNGTITMVFEKQ